MATEQKKNTDYSLVFEGFSFKEPERIQEQEISQANVNEQAVLDIVQELNGIHNGYHAEVSQSIVSIMVPNDEDKSQAPQLTHVGEQIKHLQDTIELLMGKLQTIPTRQEYNTLLEEIQKKNSEQQHITMPEEAVTALRSLQLFQSKIEQKLELINRIQQKTLATPNTVPEETLEKLKTFGLYLSKIEQKLELVHRSQQKTQSIPPISQDETLEKLQTHSLYLAKIEQKLELLQRTQQKMQAQTVQMLSTEDLGGKMQTNSLYLAKLEQKIELVQRILQKIQTTNKDADHQTQLQTNNLYLAKIEQKLEILSRIQQKNNASASNSPSNTQEFQQIVEKLTSIAQEKNQVSPEYIQPILEKLQESQQSITAITLSIANLQEDIVNLQKNQTKFDETQLFEGIKKTIEGNLVMPTFPAIDSILPAPIFWDKLATIMESNEAQIKEIKNVIDAALHSHTEGAKADTTASPDEILSSLHTNNVYLSKMEQRLETLHKTLEKLTTKRT